MDYSMMDCDERYVTAVSCRTAVTSCAPWND